MRPTLLTRALAALTLLLLAAAPAAADAPPIVGTVVDESGAPLPNARVVVGGTSRTAVTGADGRFTLRSVPAGSYHLDAELIGYAPGHAAVEVPESGDAVEVTIVMTPSPLSLEGVIVTGTPTSSDALAVTQSTVQISGRELDRNLGASLATTLGREPGITTRYAGPASSAPVIRGLTGDRVLVLENGQRTGDLSSTSADHAVSVDPLSASRVEVVRGPASLLYGASALGGVVNVISSDIPSNVPAEVHGYVAGQAESVTPGGALSGELTAPLGSSLAVTLRGGMRAADDVRIADGDVLENTYNENGRGSVGLGYVSESLTAGVAGSTYRFDYGLPFAPGAEEAGVHIEGHREEVKGRAELSLAEGLFRNLQADASAQRYRHDEVEESGEIGTTFRLSTQTFQLRGSTQGERATGAFGVSGLFRQYEPSGEEALTPAANSNSGGVFAFQEIPLGRAAGEAEHAPRLQLGARYDAYRIATEAGDPKFGGARERSFNALSGSVGVSVPLAEDVSLGASVARAFRAPTVEELFSEGFHHAAGTYDRGSPELEAETNLGVETVLHAQHSALHAQASVFYNRINDYIAPDLVGTIEIDHDGETEAVPLNVFHQDDARMYGAEGKVEWIAAEDLVLGLSGDVVRGEFESGGPLPYMPAGRVGGSVRWDDGKLSAGLDGVRAFAQERVPENELATDAYTLLGLHLGYTLTGHGGRIHAIQLRADNLLDQEYREATSRIKDFAPNPGRNLSVVYRLLF